MLESVESEQVVGVWLDVGSGTTSCHSVCVFCDPVVTFILFQLNTVIHCGTSSLVVWVGSKGLIIGSF